MKIITIQKLVQLLQNLRIENIYKVEMENVIRLLSNKNSWQSAYDYHNKFTKLDFNVSQPEFKIIKNLYKFIYNLTSPKNPFDDDCLLEIIFALQQISSHDHKKL